MNILVTSDWHVEFHADRGHTFIDCLEKKDVDVLIIAGDLTVGGADVLRLLVELSDIYPHIVYTPGNHEYYNSTIVDTDRDIRYSLRPNNVHVLYPGDTATIGGQRFLGGTLWFPKEEPDYKKIVRCRVNDFVLIRDVVPTAFDENAALIKFLKKNIKRDDIVITHHIPTPLSVSKEYTDSILNQYFLCDVQAELIDKKQPKMWVHGHTHTSFDYHIGETRIICNPFGYARVGENWDFDERKVISI